MSDINFAAGIRNLFRQKISAGINIFSFATGLAACLLLGSYLLDDFRWDRFHENGNRIYRLNRIYTLDNGEQEHHGFTYPAIAPAMVEELPEVTDALRSSWPQSMVVHRNDTQRSEDNIRYVDENFLQFFDFPLLYGDRESALSTPNSVLLHSETAQHYFGEENPVGYSVLIDTPEEQNREFVISGVLDDPPQGTHFEYNILLPMSSFPNDDPNMNLQKWDWFWFFYTYVMLADGVDYNDVTTKLPEFFAGHVESPQESYYLQPLNDIHLRSAHMHHDPLNANPGNPTIILAISFLIVFLITIASVNYVNLSIAQSLRRMKEVALRKTIGASRLQLIRLFLLESMMVTAIAMIISIAMAELFKPIFEQLSGRPLYTNLLDGSLVMISLVLLTILLGIIAGFYPALFLSSFPPGSIFRVSSSTGRQRSWIRRTLVVIQYSMTSILILSSLVLSSQMQFINNKDLGFSSNRLVSVPIPTPFFRDTERCRQVLSEIPGVESVTITSTAPGILHGEEEGIPEGSQQPVNFYRMGVDEFTLETFSFELADGRFFSPEFPSDRLAPNGGAVVLNETAVHRLGWETATGKTISIDRNGILTPLTVVGVVRDFHFQSLHSPLQPLMMVYNTSMSYTSLATIRLLNGSDQRFIAQLEDKWNLLFPGQDMEYFFYNDFIAQQYTPENNQHRVLNVFMILALVIALSGTVGMAFYSSSRRRKEIGIRKVLGARAKGIVFLLIRESFVLVIVANVISWPVAWYVMQRWLENFAYHPPISWYLFPITLVCTILLASFAGGIIAWRSANANPLNELRYE